MPQIVLCHFQLGIQILVLLMIQTFVKTHLEEIIPHDNIELLTIELVLARKRNIHHQWHQHGDCIHSLKHTKFIFCDAISAHVSKFNAFSNQLTLK